MNFSMTRLLNQNSPLIEGIRNVQVNEFFAKQVLSEFPLSVIPTIWMDGCKEQVPPHPNMFNNEWRCM
jgi:hypothetical protein